MSVYMVIGGYGFLYSILTIFVDNRHFITLIFMENIFEIIY